MSNFLQSLELQDIPNCGTCGDKPDCQQTMKAIIKGFVICEQNGELQPIVPTDQASQKFCTEALARVALCRAERQARQSQ